MIVANVDKKSFKHNKKNIKCARKCKKHRKIIKTNRTHQFSEKNNKKCRNHIEWDHNAKEIVQTQKVSNMTQIMLKFMKIIFISMVFFEPKFSWTQWPVALLMHPIPRGLG